MLKAVSVVLVGTIIGYNTVTIAQTDMGTRNYSAPNRVMPFCSQVVLSVELTTSTVRLHWTAKPVSYSF